jgi:hypothetical protein
MAQKIKTVNVRCADGEQRELALVRVEGNTAYLCRANQYRDAIQHPEACIEIGFPLSDVRMSDAIHA